MKFWWKCGECRTWSEDYFVEFCRHHQYLDSKFKALNSINLMGNLPCDLSPPLLLCVILHKFFFRELESHISRGSILRSLAGGLSNDVISMIAGAIKTFTNKFSNAM